MAVIKTSTAKDRHLAIDQPGTLVHSGANWTIRHVAGRQQGFTVWHDTGAVDQRVRWRVACFCATEEEALAFAELAVAGLGNPATERMRAALDAVRERQP